MSRALVLALVTAAAPALADAPAATPPPSQVTRQATPAEPAPTRHGLAVGVEVGDPLSATAAYFLGRLSFAAAVGSGTLAGPGLSIHVDAQLEIWRLAPSWPLRVGLGGRYYRQHYQPMSIDEIPDSHEGVRASVLLAYERGPLELYAELAPGVDVRRTASCTLASGPDSVCPHAQSLPLFLQFAIGARWFFAH